MDETSETAGPIHRKLICCLLAIEIDEHASRPVFEQIRQTQEFRQLLTEATAQVDIEELVCVVHEDGALLAFVSDSIACFNAARAIREGPQKHERYRDLSLRIGVNLGAVEIARDEFGQLFVSGEGRQDAERVMRQAQPGQVSAARSYYEVLLRVAPELASQLQRQGVFSDTIGPPLYWYQLDVPFAAPSAPRPAVTNSVTPMLGYAASPESTPPAGERQSEPVASLPVPMRRGEVRRSGLQYALLLLLAGGAGLLLLARLHPEPAVSKPFVAQVSAPPPAAKLPELASEPVAVARPVESPAPTPSVEGPAAAPPAPPPVAAETAVPPKSPRAETKASKPRNQTARARSHSKKTTTPALASSEPAPSEAIVAHVPVDAAAPELEREPPVVQRAAPPSVTGLVFLAVKPWGEVYVDGKQVGVTPPLKNIAVAPGRRVITIKNTSSPVYRTEVVVEANAKMTIAHDFTCVSTRDKPCPNEVRGGSALGTRTEAQSFETAQRR